MCDCGKFSCSNRPPKPKPERMLHVSSDIRDNDEGVVLVVKNDRWVIRAYNEGGHQCTEVDLLDVVDWFSNHHELLKFVGK